MNAQPHHYRLNPEDELTRVLNRAKVDKRPVIIETPDDRYQVIRDRETVNLTDDPWANYDPEKVQAALRAGAGALQGVDTERLLREIYEEREQDTPGRPA